LLSLVVGPVASAGTGNAAGYFVIRDGNCTLSTAGDICANNFTLPTHTILSDTSIISFYLNCADDGSGIKFDLDVLINGTSVRTFSNINTGVGRVVQEAVGGGPLVSGSNLLQIVASGDDDGNCTTSDVVLTYRLSTVP